MNKTKIKRAAVCLTLLLLTSALYGCAEKQPAKQTPEQENTAKEEKPQVEKKTIPAVPLSEAVNTFNWNYYDKQDTGSNLFYSPLSLESALAMTLKGADGDTYNELAQTLCIGDIDAFMEGCSSLSAGYNDDKAKLTLANSLWIDKTFDKEYGVDPGFISALQEKMNAEVIMEDFRNKPDKAAADITKWVKKNTGNLISDYESTATADTAMDIINAIYFFGEWKNKFSADNTYPGDFRRDEGTLQADMMNMNNEYFRYYKDGDFKGIELPYFDDKAVMDIILTQDDNDLSSPEAWKNLSAKDREDFISAISSAEETKISMLLLPKFTMDISSEGLKDTLISLGIVSAFDKGSADFSGICKNLYISDISHRAKIEVDEEGSRAAAVTEVVMELAGAMMDEEEQIDFVCDRPFVFVIRDSETGTILFTGVVNEP